MTSNLQSILEAEGLTEHLCKFTDQGVTDTILGELTDSDLKELGIEKLGERKRLLIALAHYGVSNNVVLSTIELKKKLITTQGELIYEIINEEIKITGFNGSGNLVIPDKFDDLPFRVRVIGSEAFMGNDNLLSITLPEGIREIGDSAFEDCINIKDVIIPESVTELGARAFAYCPKIEIISLPKGISFIRRSTFWSCKSLTSIVLPSSLSHICDNAFSNCHSLSSVSIPGDALTYIGQDAFFNCDKLISITLPASAINIHHNAFYGCPASINLREGLAYEIRNGEITIKRFIGSGDIVIPEELDDLSLPVRVIDSDAFQGNEMLLSVNLPNGVKSIKEQAFRGCIMLKSITFPDGLEYIGDAAFCDCSNLTELTIPESVKYIGNVAFRGCSNLVSISISESSFCNSNIIENCEKLTTIYITHGSAENDNYPSILSCLFRDCPSLNKLYLPSIFWKKIQQSYLYQYNWFQSENRAINPNFKIIFYDHNAARNNEYLGNKPVCLRRLNQFVDKGISFFKNEFLN